MMLLHPYTKEWKQKLEEAELGCDAPDDDDDDYGENEGDNEIVDWVEDDGNDDDDDDEGDDDDDEDDDDDVVEDDLVLDAEVVDEKLGIQDDENLELEDGKYWDEEFKKAMRSNEAMEKLVEKSIGISDKYYEKQMKSMAQKKETRDTSEDGDELEMRGKRAKVSPREWKLLGYGPFRRRVNKSKIPHGLFLRAAVRPFTYRNLVKEIVLTRHAILEGEIDHKK